MAQALKADDVLELLRSVQEDEPGRFAETAGRHADALQPLFDRDIDALIDDYVAELETGGTQIYDLWERTLTQALESKTIDHQQAAERKTKAKGQRRSAPTPEKHEKSDIFGLKAKLNKVEEAVRADGQIRPKEAAEEVKLGVKNATRTGMHAGKIGLLSMQILGHAGLMLHNGIKTAANGLAATHNMIPATVGQKLTAASIAFALMIGYVGVEKVAPPVLPGQEAGLTSDDLHPSAFCQNPSLWSYGGVMAAAWSVETYRANDPDNYFYQHAALAAMQQGMHPVAYWTLVGAETNFRDVIGTIASGMTQNLPATFLEKLGRHMENTDFYRTLAAGIDAGTASAQERDLKTLIDQGMREYRSDPDHYHDQVRADDPRVGPAVAYLLSLVHQPNVAAQIEAADVLRNHPDLAAENFTSSEVAFQELFFELYDSHLPGPLGEALMDFAVDHGYGHVSVSDTRSMSVMLSAFSSDVRPLSSSLQRRMSGFFDRVVDANPGPFTGVRTMSEFREGLRDYSNGKVDRFASSSFQRATGVDRIVDLCVTNPAALETAAVEGVSRLHYSAMLASYQITNITGITADDVQAGYQSVLDFSSNALSSFDAAPQADPIGEFLTRTPGPTGQ